MSTQRDELVTTGEFPKCELCGKTHVGVGSKKLCLPCQRYTQRLVLEGRLDEQRRTNYFKYSDGEVVLTFDGYDIDSTRQSQREIELQSQLDKLSGDRES